MSKQIEAMKLALEALEEIALAGMSVAPEMIDGKEAFHARQAWRFIGIAARAMESVKKALAEQPRAEGTLAPAQEPDPDELTIAYMSGIYEGKKRKPWVGLTDEEFVDLCSADMGTAALIRAVEAKLKEKNT